MKFNFEYVSHSIHVKGGQEREVHSARLGETCEKFSGKNGLISKKNHQNLKNFSPAAPIGITGI